MNNEQIQEKISAQKKKAFFAQRRYERCVTEEDGLEWYQQERELGDLLIRLGMLTEAEDVYQLVFQICSSLLQRFGSLKIKRRLADCYKNLGDICQMQKRLAEARGYYQQGIAYCGKIFQEEKQTQIFEWRTYYYMQEKLGEIYQAEGRYEEAKLYFEKSIKLCRDLLSEYHQILEILNLSVFYGIIGDFNQKIGKLHKAKLYYQQCVELKELLLREDWRLLKQDIPLQLAGMLDQLAMICWREQNYVQAEAYQRRSVELRQQRFT